RGLAAVPGRRAARPTADPQRRAAAATAGARRAGTQAERRGSGRESARPKRGAARRAPHRRALASLVGRRGRAVTRANLVLLGILVACALSLVTSRHEARQLTTELTREEARMRAYEVEYGQLSLEQSTWSMP